MAKNRFLRMFITLVPAFDYVDNKFIQTGDGLADLDFLAVGRDEISSRL